MWLAVAEKCAEQNNDGSVWLGVVAFLMGTLAMSLLIAMLSDPYEW
jgi:hypothetical protein